MPATDPATRPEAIEAFRSATRRNPKFAFAWFNMALAYQELGKPAEGLAAENPYAGTVLSGAPVDGVSLTMEGHAGQEEPLRRALVARWQALDVPARSAR